MKRGVVFLSLLCINTLVCFSQGRTFEFGKIDKAELEMKIYSPDSGASAVYLINNAEVVFNENDYSMYMKRHVRIKFLNEDGFDYADITLPYLKGENLQRLKSATYNLENGKITTTEVSKRDWVNEKYNDDLMEKKVSFPDVKVGSIIEYAFEQNMGSFRNMPGWRFQTDIPVKYTEFKTDIPRYGSYQPGFKGYLSPTYYKPGSNQYHVIMEEVPALKKEPYVATMENFRAEIDFEIKSISIPGYGTEVFLEDWAAIAGSLANDDDYGEAIDNLGQLRRIYPEDQGWGNDLESMKSIFNYVRDHFEWNEYYRFKIYESPRSLWEEGTGTNADINHILTMFLRNAGIEANPVIISTRRNGYINRLVPLTRQFNYALTCAKIGDKEYLLDATDKFRPYNVLPERAMNGEGLLVTEERYRWVDLSLNNEMDAKTFSADFKLNDDDLLEGKVTIVARGLAAANLRESIYEENKAASEPEEEETEEETDDQESLDDYKVGEVSNVEIKNALIPEESLQISYDFTSETNTDFIGTKLFMNPVIIKFAEENPFKLESRIYPVEFPAPISNTYVFGIEIPEGYEVEELPKAQNLVLPENGGRYSYLSAVQGNKIQLMIRLSLSKRLYMSEEYPALKEFFNIIIAKQQEQIVFKEKSE